MTTTELLARVHAIIKRLDELHICEHKYRVVNDSPYVRQRLITDARSVMREYETLISGKGWPMDNPIHGPFGEAFKLLTRLQALRQREGTNELMIAVGALERYIERHDPQRKTTES